MPTIKKNTTKTHKMEQHGKSEPALQVDAFILRTCELEPDIHPDELAERVWYSYGYLMDGDDVLERIKIYFYDGDNHFSLN